MALSGTNIDISPGTYMMTYKEKGAIAGRVDHMLHIASYYGIYNSLVDISNYQAFQGYSYFPVVFKNGISRFPTIGQIENAPEDIKWELYPKIKYLAVVDSENDKGIKGIHDYFKTIFTIDDFSIWARKKLKQIEKGAEYPKIKTMLSSTS